MAIIKPLPGFAGLPHDSLTELGNDDHPQYLLVDPTDRKLIANLNFNLNQALNFVIENVGSLPAAGNVGRLVFLTTDDSLYKDNGTSWQSVGTGTGVSDHGALFGLDDDDHPQYLLANGSRALLGDLDLGTNNIINVNLVDGRNISTDGINLDSHLDGSANQHDASEIDVEGTYTNIPNTPTDLESTLSSLDTVINGLNADIAAAGDDLGNHIMTQDLQLNGFDFTSNVVDGATAIAYQLKTSNLLSTEGSKLLSLENNGIEFFNIRQGSDIFGITDSTLFQFNDNVGNQTCRLAIEDETYFQFDMFGPINKPDSSIYAVNDITYSAGYIENSVELSMGNYAPAGRVRLQSVKDGDGFSHLLMNFDEINFRVNDSSGATGAQTKYVMNGRPLSAFNNEISAEALHVWGVESGLLADRLAIGKDGILYGGSGELSSSQYSDWTLKSVSLGSNGTIAFILDTVNSHIGTAKLLSVKNFGTERFSVDNAGNVTLSGTVDGRDVATDGSALDGHLDGGINKHDASEIDVEGTYTNITGTPTDLESTVSAIDSVLGSISIDTLLWDRTALTMDANTSGAGIYGVTDTSVPRTITLDTDDVVDGRVIVIKDESGNAGTNNITIDTEAAETIDGAASVLITANFGIIRLYSDGTNWFSF